MISRIVARRPSAGLGALVAVSVTIAGCGSAQRTATVSAAGVAEMDAHLAAVESSAADHDRVRATTELNGFARDVARARSSGALTSSVYAALETGIARARDRIEVEVVALAPVAQTTTTAPTPLASATPAPSTQPAAAQPGPGVKPGKIRAGPTGAKGPGPGRTPGKGPGGGRGKGHGKGG
jgi:hypothetical protein